MVNNGVHNSVHDSVRNGVHDGARLSMLELLVMTLMEEYLRQVELWCEKLGLTDYDVATHGHRHVTSDPSAWEDSKDEENLKEMMVDAFMYKDKMIGSFSITSDNRYCIRLYNLDEENTVASTYYGVRT